MTTTSENFKSGLESAMLIGLAILTYGVVLKSECEKEKAIFYFDNIKGPLMQDGICDKGGHDFFNVAAEVGAMLFVYAAATRVACAVAEIVPELVEAYCNYSQDQIDGMLA